MSSLSIFKQRMRERLGTVEDRSDVKEASEMIGVANEFRDRIKKTEKAFDKYAKSFKATAATYNDLGESSHECYVDAKVSLEQEFLANAFLKLSESEKVLADSTKAWGDRLDYDVGRFLRILLDEEVKDLEKSENRLEQARLAYDAVVTDVQQARKKDHKGAKSEAYEEKELQARKKFEAVGQEMVDEMADLNALIECEVIERLCDYIDSTREQFASLSRYFNEMVPFVYQARRYVQEGRERKIGELATFKEEMERLASMPIESSSSSSSSKKPSKVSKTFGVPVGEVVNALPNGARIPPFLVDAIDWLEKHAMKAEGLFRMNASANALAVMKSQIDKEGNASFPADLDPNLVAGIIKLWFREMPEPILTHGLYASFIETNNLKDDAAKLAQLKTLIGQLPQINRDVLHFLMAFLYKFSLGAAESKMNAGNLATCFAPNLISPAVMNLTTFDPFEPRTVVEFMIGSWDKFSDDALLAEIVRSVRPASATSSPYASPPSSPRGGSATALLSTSSPGEPAKKLAPLPPARKPRSSSAAPMPTNRLRSNTATADVRSASGSSTADSTGPVRARPPPPQRPSRNNLSYATVRNAGMKAFKTTGSEDAELQAQNKVDALDLAHPQSAEHTSLSDSAHPAPVITFSVASDAAPEAPRVLSPIPVAKTIFYSSTPPPADDKAPAQGEPVQPVVFSLMSAVSSNNDDVPSKVSLSSIPVGSSEQSGDLSVVVEEDPPEK